MSILVVYCDGDALNNKRCIMTWLLSGGGGSKREGNVCRKMIVLVLLIKVIKVDHCDSPEEGGAFWISYCFLEWRMRSGGTFLS